MEVFERLYVRPAKGRVLIIGSFICPGRPDRRPLHDSVVGMDMRAGDGVDLVHDLEEPPPAGLGVFAHIECLSVLEHAKRPWLLAEHATALLRPGGTIYCGVPTIWRYHPYPRDYWRFTSDGLEALWPGIEWEVMKYTVQGSPHLYPVPKIPRQKDFGYNKTELYAFGRKSHAESAIHVE